MKHLGNIVKVISIRFLHIPSTCGSSSDLSSAPPTVILTIEDTDLVSSTRTEKGCFEHGVVVVVVAVVLFSECVRAFDLAVYVVERVSKEQRVVCFGAGCRSWARLEADSCDCFRRTFEDSSSLDSWYGNLGKSPKPQMGLVAFLKFCVIQRLRCAQNLKRD